MRRPYVRIDMQPRGAPIGVIRVVRVHIAGRVDIPHIVGVVAVGRTTEAVLRQIQLTAHSYFYILSPRRLAIPLSPLSIHLQGWSSMRPALRGDGIFSVRALCQS